VLALFVDSEFTAGTWKKEWVKGKIARRISLERLEDRGTKDWEWTLDVC